MSDDQKADLTDKELVRRIQAGDESEFEELFRRYNKRIIGFCFQRLAGVPAARELAEDLAQETWIRVKRGIATFCEQETCRFSTWVFRIAKRVLISANRYRKADKRDPGTEIVPLDHDGEDEQVMDRHAPTPLEHALAEEFERRLRRAIEQLPEDERAVIRLRYVDGLTVKETAGTLGLTDNQVVHLESKARKRLIKSLGDDQGRSA